MAICEELVFKCRECKYLFRRDERYLNCPDCGADRTCGKYAIKGSVVCRHHGGPSIKRKYGGRHGLSMKTGKQSKSLIPRMASKYLEMGENAMYVLGRKSIDLLDQRILDLLERTDAESSPERMERIIRYWKALNDAVPGLKYDVSNDKEALRAYNMLDDEMQAAFHDYESWKQIFEALELRRKHTESEVKILEKLKAMMTAEDGMELVSQLFAAVMKVLKNEPKGHHLVQLIRIEFEGITGATTGGEVSTGGEEIIDL